MRRARGEEQEATDRLGRHAGAEPGADEREALARIAKLQPRRARARAELAPSGDAGAPEAGGSTGAGGNRGAGGSTSDIGNRGAGGSTVGLGGPRAGLVDGVRRLWSSPTRRHFLGLVLAAGAVSVSGEALRSPAEPRHTWNGRTRWIGHC